MPLPVVWYTAQQGANVMREVPSYEVRRLLAQEHGVPIAVAQHWLNRLRDRGWITVQQTVPGARGVAVVKLTDQGRSVLARKQNEARPDPALAAARAKLMRDLAESVGVEVASEHQAVRLIE